MTSRELASHLSRIYGFKEWPDTFEVDAETYANCCQTVFNQALEVQFPHINHDFMLEIAVGKNNGLMFKNVELILKGYPHAGNRR